MKYKWACRYATDRFDLENDRGHLIAWITRNRIDGDPKTRSMDTMYITRGFLGYIDKYWLVSAPDAKYAWNIWWIQRDEQGYMLPESGTDGVEHFSMKEAKLAVQKIFDINQEDVVTIDHSNWNYTKYDT